MCVFPHNVWFQICSHAPQHVQARLARTCKYIHEPLLKALYRHVAVAVPLQVPLMYSEPREWLRETSGLVRLSLVFSRRQFYQFFAALMDGKMKYVDNIFVISLDDGTVRKTCVLLSVPFFEARSRLPRREFIWYRRHRMSKEAKTETEDLLRYLVNGDLLVLKPAVVHAAQLLFDLGNGFTAICYIGDKIRAMREFTHFAECRCSSKSLCTSLTDSWDQMISDKDLGDVVSLDLSLFLHGLTFFEYKLMFIRITACAQNDILPRLSSRCFLPGIALDEERIEIDDLMGLIASFENLTRLSLHLQKGMHFFVHTTNMVKLVSEIQRNRTKKLVTMEFSGWPTLELMDEARRRSGAVCNCEECEYLFNFYKIAFHMESMSELKVYESMVMEAKGLLSSALLVEPFSRQCSWDNVATLPPKRKYAHAVSQRSDFCSCALRVCPRIEECLTTYLIHQFRSILDRFSHIGEPVCHLRLENISFKLTPLGYKPIHFRLQYQTDLSRSLRVANQFTRVRIYSKPEKLLW